MTDLIRYASALSGIDAASPPPVDNWNPSYCGELDLVIREDGVWVHEGVPIERARLVRLFSTVIKREGDKYFLVTPHEKFSIMVEDAPFVAVLMEARTGANGQILTFTTNVGDRVVAGPENRIDYRRADNAKGGAPYLFVRRGLEAKIARAAFFDLVDLCETREIDGEDWFGAASDGVFFPFARAVEIFGTGR